MAWREGGREGPSGIWPGSERGALGLGCGQPSQGGRPPVHRHLPEAEDAREGLPASVLCIGL